MTEAIRVIYWNVGEQLGSFTVYLTAMAAILVLFYGIVRDEEQTEAIFAIIFHQREY
jgi:hypothetical protein